MRFKRHSRLEGRHAFLSPSQYHWINYDRSRLTDRFYTMMAARVGTEQHAYAAKAIGYRVRMEDDGSVLSLYINDCIEHRMTPEVLLYYSDNCFGTADAIKFHRRALHIFDYKSGVTRASVHQLEVYSAIFCLEYEIDPHEIDIELRIYQEGPICPRIYDADPKDIDRIMRKIVLFDRHLSRLQRKGGILAGRR